MLSSAYRSAACIAVAAIVSAFSGANTAQAQTRTWIGVSGANWNTTTNWSAADVPDSSVESALFNGSGAGGTATVVFNAAIGGGTGLGGLTVTNAQLSPVAITNTGAFTNFRVVTGSNIDINAGAAAFSLGVGGTGFQLVPQGGGTVTFTNNSANTATLGSMITDFEGGGDAAFGLNFAGSGTWQVDASISPTNLDAGSTLTKSGTGTLILNATNAYTGNTTIGVNVAGQRVGVIRATASGALGSGGTITIGPGGNDATARLELSGGGVTLSNAIALPGRANNTAAIQNVSGSNSLSGTITLGTGGNQYRIQSDVGLLTLSNATAITSAAGGTRVVTLQGAGNGVVSGAITQTGGTVVALVKEGAGTWTLSAANTYDGGTTINDGRVVIGGASGLLGANTAANAVVINANGTLEFGRAGGPWLHPITGTGNVDVSANIVQYSGDLSGFNGNVNILAGGRFALGADNSGSANAAWNVDGILSLNGTRTISLGELSGSGQIFTGAAINAPVNTFVVGGLNTDSTFSGTIGFPSNSGINLTKTGTGILTLSGNNTYNGATNINDGTLLVNGLHTGGGAYTVASAGTLGGSGNISGPAVSLSGTVSPGDGVGTLSADNFNWQNGGVYDWEIASVSGTAGVAWDLLDLSGGTLAFVGGGPYEVDIDATAASFTAQNYLFEIARASSISAFNATNFSLSVDGAENYQWSIRQQGNSLFLQAVALPEPSTWILFAVGGVMLGLASWLRRARVKITN